MTTKTATQNLTKPTPTDDPRQMASYLASLAGDVDARMAAQLRTLARSQVPPAALVRMTASRAFSSLDVMPNIPFDTVAFDTTGTAVDLTTNPYVINLVSPGWWVVGGFVAASGWPAVIGELSIWMQAGGSTQTVAFHDGQLGYVSGGCSVFESTDYPLGETCALGAQHVGPMISGQEGSTLLYAELWAYKVRDL